MSRLTKKEEWTDVFTNVKFNYKTNDIYAFEKLGKLEDLEEELGCPLEVVFKALKSLGQDIIYDWQDGINKMYHKDTPSDEFCLVYCCPNGTGPFEYCFLFKDNIGIEICLPLKYYGKTWWLRDNRKE